MKQHPLILPLSEVRLSDHGLVGGKSASLGEMMGNLSQLGILIPDGFAITTHAFEQFLSYSNLQPLIESTIEKIDFSKIESLQEHGSAIRSAIKNAPFPDALALPIIQSYEALSDAQGQPFTDVAVRSSATAEDMPDASFAGQQETYLNVSGKEALINAIRNCFASLYTDRAISYRKQFGYDANQVGLSICVQQMVRSDLATAGVAFSLDTETGFKDVVVINAAYGLGELLVQGAVSPDEYLVFKPTLKEGYPAIIEKKLGTKAQQMVYGKDSANPTLIINTDEAKQSGFCLSEKQVLQLARWVCQIEDFYTRQKGHWCPMDIEWAVDGLTNKLYIVQARPETIHARKKLTSLVEYQVMRDGHSPIVQGIAVGSKAAVGSVNILNSLDSNDAAKAFKPGEILVTDMTDPDWEPLMKQAAAIITNKGGRTCHAAIVAREMGVPAIVGCGNATDLLSNGQIVTASCAEGEEGFVYEGKLEIKVEEHDLTKIPQTQTPIMLNVGSPSAAFQAAALPHKGVGLAREEFIINNYIKAHPLVLLRHKECNDPILSKKIAELIKGFEDEASYFIQKLSYGIAKIAAAFYPEKVIVRFSDFKTNEYYNLLGGNHFEPIEENPMIGWRGASRYYAENYKEAFGLECKAIQHVRENLGLSNVTVMIPFCRTVEELSKVKEVMKEYGLERGKEGLELFLMAELPSNILMADAFAKQIDGFSIGSNDLTQLTLGLDRDSSLVAHLYDERNDAVKMLIANLIYAAKSNGIKVGICGQGPSDFPDFAQFLVESGIDSISVTPDSIIKTAKAVYEIEQRLMVSA